MWDRASSDANIQAEVDRAALIWRNRKNDDGSPSDDAVDTVVGWWRMTDTEWEMMSRDRDYRNAIVRNGSGKCEHDMPRARELHRNLIRTRRADEFIKLDGEWMRATGRGDAAEAARVEAERQKLRDAPADPRIDTASTVEELKAL
jgi:hypothetical protein